MVKPSEGTLAMSDRLLLNVWERYAGHNGTLLLLLAIAAAANEDGDCDASLADLAFAARTSRTTCLRSFKQLQEENWVTKRRTLGGGGKTILQMNSAKLMSYPVRSFTTS